MRIVFLDVDGVLNCMSTKERYHGFIGVDDTLVGNFAEFIRTSSEEEETQIVLSSSWRIGQDRTGADIPDGYEYLQGKLAEHGLSIYDDTPLTPVDARVGVNIGIERFYEAYFEGSSFDEVVDKAVETVNHGINERPDFDIDSFTDYSHLKDSSIQDRRSSSAITKAPHCIQLESVLSRSWPRKPVRYTT